MPWLCGRIKRINEEEGKQYHLSYNIKAVGKNIKWGGGEGGQKIQIKKKWEGEEYQVVGNFIHPWWLDSDDGEAKSSDNEIEFIQETRVAKWIVKITYKLYP